MKGGAANLDATNNGWGTTDTAALETQIRDFADDIFLGDALIVPVLSAHDANAGPP